MMDSTSNACHYRLILLLAMAKFYSNLCMYAGGCSLPVCSVIESVTADIAINCLCQIQVRACKTM